MNEMHVAVAIVELLKEMGGWGLGSLVALIMITPPLVGLIGVFFGVHSARTLERTMVDGLAKIEVIANAMVTKYDNNMEFVQETQKMMRSYQALVDTLLQVVRDNTTALTKVTERIAGMKQGRD